MGKYHLLEPHATRVGAERVLVPHCLGDVGPLPGRDFPYLVPALSQNGWGGADGRS